ncbi:MAG: family 43 glycosylhydrolase [Chitinophagaceae bacterium]
MKCFLYALLILIFRFQVSGQLLVLPGDHPDPSVVKIGDTYWASATTSNWFPAFPLIKSKDLLNWQASGNVFNKLPDWADYYFWAPEISYENGKVYVYYAAHKKNGNLCIAVASADKPEGPYRDHGPLMCQEDGSIDAFPIRDENGKLHLVWKEDGNSVGKPTPIWAMEMNETRTALIGEKKQLFRNTETWEANLVEGVAMIRHNNFFYAFYAAGGCCGKGCTYTSGIARSKNLLGPWEKFNSNPVLKNTDNWICQGHGTPVEKDGRFYFLYHAYDKKSNVYTGRQGVLKEFKFTADNWIQFVDIPATAALPVVGEVYDKFEKSTLSDKWQWSVFQQVSFSLQNGKLFLETLPGRAGAFIGQKTLSGKYKATARILTKNSSAGAGIGAIGNDFNLVYATCQKGNIRVVTVKEGKLTTIVETFVAPKTTIYISMEVVNSKEVRFSYASDGKNFKVLNKTAIDASYLPPWDRAVRVGLISTGEPGQKAAFDSFRMVML